MKQLIVLISTILLGIAISVVVLGFKTDVTDMKTNVDSHLDTVIESFDPSTT